MNISEMDNYNKMNIELKKLAAVTFAAFMMASSLSACGGSSSSDSSDSSSSSDSNSGSDNSTTAPDNTETPANPDEQLPNPAVKPLALAMGI